MEDGSANKALESAASYTGSTNPGGTFKYVVRADSACVAGCAQLAVAMARGCDMR